MKVKYCAFLCILVMVIVSLITSQYHFILITALAVAPTVVLYPNVSLDELHNNKESFSRLKLLIHPLVVFLVLMLTQHKWIAFFNEWLCQQI